MGPGAGEINFFLIRYEGESSTLNEDCCRKEEDPGEQSEPEIFSTIPPKMSIFYTINRGEF